MRYLITWLALCGLTCVAWSQAPPGRPDRTSTPRQGQQRPANPSPTSRTATPAKPTPPPGVIVRGQANKPDEARQEAYKAAHEHLLAYLRQAKPDANWLPTRTDIERLVRFKEVRKFVPTPKLEQILEAPVDQEIYEAEVEVLPESYEHLLRIVVAHERQWVLTKGLLGVLALLIIVVGYVRMDASTEHRYRGWLQGLGLAAVVLTVMVISSLP